MTYMQFLGHFAIGFLCGMGVAAACAASIIRNDRKD